MKKVLLAFIVLVSAVVFSANFVKADDATGKLVVHFQKWDNDYEGLGAHGWNGISAVGEYTRLDEFGAVFEYDVVPGEGEIGFIAVNWGEPGVAETWTDAVKFTDDVMIDKTLIVAAEETHIYIFEGASVKAGSDMEYLVADNDKANMILVYFDPAGYGENLGVHSWGGWDMTEPGWGDPAKIFVPVGKNPGGQVVMGALLTFAVDKTPGLLIYEGEDANKKTGDVSAVANAADEKPGAFEETPTAGEVGVAYVYSKGNGYTENDNVSYNDVEAFAEEAFKFSIIPANPQEETGTYAVDPRTIRVELNQQVSSPYPKATDKDAARAIVESWFTVKEIVTPATETTPAVYGDALTIERVDFALTSESISSFVVILDEETPLDNTKQYKLFFDLGLPTEALAEEKEVTVTIKVKAPENTPAEAVLSIAGDLPEAFWDPTAEVYAATKEGDFYVVTFKVKVKEVTTVFEYKWTRGSWDDDEFIAENRKFVVYNNQDTVTIIDEVLAWKDIDAPDEKYDAPVVNVQINLSADIDVDMDTEGPTIQFLGSLLGKPESERIIVVDWGLPFDQNLFPAYRASDDRDNRDWTPAVIVPKGDFSVLDTRTEGDYVIMLQVTDKWGNTTQEKFTFRVTKSQ